MMENEPVKTWIKNDPISRDGLLVSLAVILGSIIIACALWLPGTDILSGMTAKAPAAGTDNAADAGAKEDTTAVASLDDDPVQGDKKKAKVAIIEFSDYECPYCKRFHQETYDKLVKDYVTTGKAVISFRDFPLSFHDPKATEEAALAECVGAEKGDAAYFAFSKGLYTNTGANGQGLPAGKVDELIRAAGADVKKVTACAATDAVKQEIQKDMADGQKAGVSGTPSFIIGKLGADGTVTGERIVGALPYEGFKAAIDKYLE
ncbi:MAG: hypothetical protein A2808_04085 [Candidatus Moranbacteria bacterium RIFCSPHIGHO2_01_FULL_55_24]|nr:MAG: hypothetical protein A2808_04085 [Candidatus Moranbacteria bacterium RIFCSPHIGHO2_01_FULL_55_24]